MDIATAQTSCTLTANEEKTFAIPVSIKDGYRPLDFITVRISGSNAVQLVGDNYYLDGQVYIYLRNTVATNTTIVAVVSVLCSKNI